MWKTAQLPLEAPLDPTASVYLSLVDQWDQPFGPVLVVTLLCTSVLRALVRS